MITLKNEKIKIEIAEHGAELCSIVAAGREYLWQADPKFWNRHSPVLFPFVGRVWNNEYRHQGKVYTIGQHGFARDMDFALVAHNDNAAKFKLDSSDQTLAKYPFPFSLEISYVLAQESIAVEWRVTNTGSEPMHFQIGAHPAFYYRDLDTTTSRRAFLEFGSSISRLEYISPTEKGCTSCERHTLDLDGGVMEITTSSFDCDTYIFDRHQVEKITLADKHRMPYLSLIFDTPLVAIWSPSATKPDVPFICIEPWYGRCDRVGYCGELADRDCMEHLAAGEVFSTRYLIKIEDI